MPQPPNPAPVIRAHQGHLVIFALFQPMYQSSNYLSLHSHFSAHVSKRIDELLVTRPPLDMSSLMLFVQFLHRLHAAFVFLYHHLR